MVGTGARPGCSYVDLLIYSHTILTRNVDSNLLCDVSCQRFSQQAESVDSERIGKLFLVLNCASSLHLRLGSFLSSSPRMISVALHST